MGQERKTNTQQFKFFSELVFKHIGILYDESEAYKLEKRLEELVENFELSSIQDLYDLLSNNPDSKIISQFISMATNNETQFFRDSVFFDVFFQEIIPYVVEKFSIKNSLNQLRIWSAACSTGEEPLSLCIGLKEKFPLLKTQIYASDVDDNVLSKAKKGVFSQIQVERGIDNILLRKYFTNFEDEELSRKLKYYQIDKTLLDSIKWFKFNLFKDSFPFNQYHIIFCRNVLIYQDDEHKIRIIDQIYDSLVSGGILILGSSEMASLYSEKFREVKFKNFPIYQKP